MDFKVHLGKMDFKVNFLKVGLFAPALVIDTVHHFFHSHRSHPHTTTNNIIVPHCPHASKGKQGNQELAASRWYGASLGGQKTHKCNILQVFRICPIYKYLR
jgi:hypothetical protein